MRYLGDSLDSRKIEDLVKAYLIWPEAALSRAVGLSIGVCNLLKRKVGNALGGILMRLRVL